MRELPRGNLLKCLVYYKENLQLGFLVARRDSELTRDQYLQLIDNMGIAQEKSKQRWLEKMPKTPFCTAALSPKAVYYPSLSWMANFERCAAVAWFRERDAVR